MSRRVLIVDDDPAVLQTLADGLSDTGVDVATAADGSAALREVGSRRPDIVLADVRMAHMDGLELLRTLRERAPDIDVVIMTAYDDMPTVVGAMRGGAAEFLTKPIDLHGLRSVVNRLFEDRRARRAARSADDRSAAGELIGRTPAMIAIHKLIGQAASTTATVLVRGESGTGKELVARAIHSNSARAAEPMVAVNCGALPSTLLESELFGHVRGAFTGAHAARRGRFAAAERGTIFLDEIGDTSVEFQTKLLRVLQDREYQPVGGDEIRHTDARVIAATHQNLEALVAERRFREDVYYRLRVVEIVVPPLRERRDDIPLIVRALLDRASASLGTPPMTITDAALGYLVEQPWPGNVRELENCVLRATVMAPGSVIRPEHLSISSPVATGKPGRVRSLDEIEREHVAGVLALTNGQKRRAAELLGISRPRLDRLIEKHALG